MKSKILPKLLGILLVADFAAITLWFFQYFMFPTVTFVADVCVTISLIAEFGLTLWLLINGVRKESLQEE